MHPYTQNHPWNTIGNDSPRPRFSGPQLVGWTKHVSETGAPYYAHHVSHVTQWLDPRLDLVLSGIARHNDVQ